MSSEEMRGKRGVWLIALLALMVLLASPGVSWSQEGDEDLEDRIEKLEKEMDGMRSEKERKEKHARGISLGGYGEIHANFVEGRENGNQIDLHRLVLFLGYDFNDWIKFRSETEIEHAFVADGDGELVMEQAYVDLLLSDEVNVRVGRVLVPMGIVNWKHEPPAFNGVERPSFSKYIIPSTWSGDGAGIFGGIGPAITYQAYALGGMNGSKFSATSGIRSGRIKERPSLNEVAATGRIDIYPFATVANPFGQLMRVGLSAYGGGIDNGDQGKDPDIKGWMEMYSADFEYTIAALDLRGAAAWTRIDDAEEIGSGLASQIFGWYGEAGLHVWPDQWKKGKLRKSDLVTFARFDDYDTQFLMPHGVDEDPAGDRQEWTFGMTWFLVPNFVIKADYQIRENGTDDELENLVNFGIGWQM